MIRTDDLRLEERVAFALRQLYRAHGYAPYRMSKFEEYDFYVRNKSFLVSDSILTFTDADGRLMALKPDVTLSIVRNTRDGEVRKVYYHENVYRPARGDRAYREIPQVGLECIGATDEYSLREVLSLAEESLSEISGRSILTLSHLGLLTEVIRRSGYPEQTHPELFRCIGEKNRGGIEALTAGAGLPAEAAGRLIALVTRDGGLESVLTLLESLWEDAGWRREVERFRRICAGLSRDRVRVDFSIVSDRSYYNSIVFVGYAEGIPERILSGGQYDQLMHKLGKTSGAVGFAVYLDQLERLSTAAVGCDADVLLLYDASVDPERVARTVSDLIASGKRVLAATRAPENGIYGETVRLGKEADNG